MNCDISDIGRRALQGERLSRPHILQLVEAARQDPHELFYWAYRVRTAVFGNCVKFCSIIPGKFGGCTEDCKWCAQPGKLSPPKMTACEEIHTAARRSASLGSANFGVVNSGRRPTPREFQAMLDVTGQLGEAQLGLTLCGAYGELTDDQARQLAAAGVRRYNHNLETSRRFYPQVVSTHSYDDRLRTLAAARKAGLELCCGGIFGIGETWDDRIDLALTLRDEVAPEAVPMNFLHPIPGTALETYQPMPPMEILAVIAIYRLILPRTDLKIAGGRELNLRDLQSWMFYVGGTSCLIGNYLATAGRDPQTDLQMIRDVGLEVVKKLPTEG